MTAIWACFIPIFSRTRRERQFSVCEKQQSLATSGHGNHGLRLPGLPPTQSPDPKQSLQIGTRDVCLLSDPFGLRFSPTKPRSPGWFFH